MTPAVTHLDTFMKKMGEPAPDTGHESILGLFELRAFELSLELLEWDDEPDNELDSEPDNEPDPG